MKKKVVKKIGNSHTTNEVKRYLGSLAEDFQGKIDSVIEQFNGINTKLDGHGRALNTHTEMIGKLLLDVQDIKNEKIGRTDFSMLEKRVTRIENILHGVKRK